MHLLMETSDRVVLDMSNIQFVDSTGLGVLISCLRLTHNRQGDLYLCGLSSALSSRFELMRLHRIFNIYGTTSEAVSAFSLTTSNLNDQ